MEETYQMTPLSQDVADRMRCMLEDLESGRISVVAADVTTRMTSGTHHKYCLDLEIFVKHLWTGNGVAVTT